MTTPRDVLHFWFDGDSSTFRDVWFKRHDAFDAACCRFTDAVQEARTGALDDWLATPHGALALVILLDQFSRNLFRGSPESYAADPQAREVTRTSIARGFDQRVGPVERSFFYLPFMHSEDLSDQDESVRLFSALHPSERYAEHHRDAIRRFGRFPHRNAILGRTSTQEEIEYMREEAKMADDVVIGTGRYRYRFRRDWAKLPRWWNFGETHQPGPPRTSVKGAVAANGDVYVLCRAAHPVLVFDADGRFVTSWGEGEFSSFVHGMTIDAGGKIWIADSGMHTVTQHEPDGTLLRTLGMRGAAQPTLYGKPFNMPTGIAFASNGDVFVSDGYGNRRVHCFTPDGELKHAWGEPGTGPGQFALVHFIGADANDTLYVCDRENHRIQLFATTGEVLGQWTGFDMPSDLAFGRDLIYVAAADGVSIWTKERQKLAHFGRNEPFDGAFNVHGIWLDAEENIYLAQFDRAVSKLSRE
jgi:uncharacterized protein (DUF924 family)